ncbi:MAG: hypothetical protein A2429_03125 [Candidatus Veblenbacteria bacterium RIFOXYC1_FULL_42_9]|uniref:Uncharacterized protein n=1 Tax=Candidatus Veblenbacteria bacterium RIFOXYC1_FULL_42_9 TaxID=1802427 RepID=A0A1G2Q5S3_9BACT|nr:MAG: hypothetical protein A2429_03125 [Candidatus Veblenbacteria bacterium RIFOXYC1_FULL_42_9]
MGMNLIKNKKGVLIMNKQLLLTACAVVIISIMTIVGINILSQSTEQSETTVYCIVTDNPVWGQGIGQAGAQRLDNGCELNVFFNNSKIKLGTLVRVVVQPNATDSLYAEPYIQ